MVSFEAHLLSRGSKRRKQLFYSMIQVAIWVIWRCRNNLVFNQKGTYVGRGKRADQALGFTCVKIKQMGLMYHGPNSVACNIFGVLYLMYSTWCGLILLAQD
ncbi:hypothetical protein Hanom_Chr10g00894881 [Helianthus anomalus]